MSPTNQTVPEGKATNISCKVTSGVPKPSLSWNFGGGSLPEEVIKIEIENGSVLQIQNTTKGMDGTYKCVAKNKAKEKIATSTLHVLGMFWFWVQLYRVCMFKSIIIINTQF